MIMVVNIEGMSYRDKEGEKKEQEDGQNTRILTSFINLTFYLILFRVIKSPRLELAGQIWCMEREGIYKNCWVENLKSINHQGDRIDGRILLECWGEYLEFRGIYGMTGV
jgi:hypothetical protein